MKKLILCLPCLLLIFLLHGHSKTFKINPSSYDHRTFNRTHEQLDIFLQQLAIKNKYSEDGWTLIWQEEFHEDLLDTKTWNIEDWASEKNNELQYYTPKNISITANQLQLISNKEDYKGRSYTSAAIHTKDKFYFRYGKVEMRAKLPSGQGIFPAFWMMPNIDNTWLPEIDILEMLGDKPYEIWMVQHWLDNNQQLVSRSSSYQGPNYAENFHTYSLEWAPDSLKWFIDGELRFQTKHSSPDMDMYLYVNTAIGGDWPGNPDETTSFQQVFEIDYMRVYQQKGDGQK
ncbi:glycoside hydrolase family 16 protein [Gracilibacillus sp. S3-1-1]|uniref:Glycoside hydrolase family 16 protein n=1 Tax=Gracilibacillus pellucidus TaxID=3095368 RepID=A0ACC6M3U4_9BACI|nr:glycoside hydrolase family 16 protein [Gracilibacillus sp. S3-1-1]MDX8045611.1 glycoside hydrolase family 16 protein [Gracilibacillus sp. S3-1-1]